MHEDADAQKVGDASRDGHTVLGGSAETGMLTPLPPDSVSLQPLRGDVSGRHSGERRGFPMVKGKMSH